jgi:hypothetical protein
MTVTEIGSQVACVVGRLAGANGLRLRSSQKSGVRHFPEPRRTGLIKRFEPITAELNIVYVRDRV